MSDSSRLMHLLLVEDDEIHAHLVQRNLKKSRIANTVAHVDDGEKAIQYLKCEGEYADAQRPDIILLDLKLPKVDGHEVLSTIKQDPDLTSIPVVILTTSKAEQDVQSAYARHVNSYVVKPLNAEGFRKLIEDLDLYWGMVNVVPPKNAA